VVCHDAAGSPFFHLQQGQVLLDMGDHDRAVDELMRAYMGAGPNCSRPKIGDILAFSAPSRARLSGRNCAELPFG
jgi:hypothetical protein